MSKRDYLAIFMVLVLSILATAGYIVYRGGLAKTSKDNTILVVDERKTAGWKTFVDTKSGLSLKLPADGWSEFPKGGNETPLYLKNEKDGNKDYSVEIFIGDGTIEDAIKNDSTIRLSKGKPKNASVSIGGKKATQVVGVINRGSGQPYINTLIPNNDKVVKIVLLNESDKEVYDLILSTVRFSN